MVVENGESFAVVWSVVGRQPQVAMVSLCERRWAMATATVTAMVMISQGVCRSVGCFSASIDRYPRRCATTRTRLTSAEGAGRDNDDGDAVALVTVVAAPTAGAAVDAAADVVARPSVADS